MSFAELHLNENIHKAIEACGYTQPTPVQEKSIPAILAGKDVVASAQTGTGKTASFVLPALHHLSLQKPSQKTKILILTPTRELAQQITKAADQYGKFLKFRIVSLVGGMSYYHQIRDLNRGADIIVATPGRLLDHVENKRVDLSNVDMLVLDEADRMLDMGFTDDVTAITNMTPKTRQTLLFSATVDKELDGAIRKFLRNPIRINLSTQKLSAPKIEQQAYRAKDMNHKIRLLRHFMSNENMFKAIIFSATKRHADRLAMQLRQEGYAAAALHGDLKQNARNRTVEQLRKGRIQYLVATDVAARGIDISDVTHVINFDMPRFCEDYVHRIGRTGRAGKEGIAISFVTSVDFKHLQRIEKYIGQRLKLIANIDGVKAPALDDIVPFVDEPPKRSFGGKRPANRERFGSNDQRSGNRRSRFSDRDNRAEGRRSRFSDSDNRSEGRRSRFSDSDNRSEGRRSRFSDGDNRSEGRRSRFSDSDNRSEGRRSRFSDGGNRSEGRKSRFSDDGNRTERRRSRFSDDNSRAEGGNSRPSEGGNRAERRRARFGDHPEGRRTRFSDDTNKRSSDGRKSRSSAKRSESKSERPSDGKKYVAKNGKTTWKKKSGQKGKFKDRKAV